MRITRNELKSVPGPLCDVEFVESVVVIPRVSPFLSTANATAKSATALSFAVASTTCASPILLTVTVNGTFETSSLLHCSGSSSSSSSVGSPPFGPATAVTFGILQSASAAFMAMDSASSAEPSADNTKHSQRNAQHVLPFCMPSDCMFSAAPAPCALSVLFEPPRERSPEAAADNDAAPDAEAPSKPRSSARASSAPAFSPPRPSYLGSALALSSTAHDRRPCVG